MTKRTLGLSEEIHDYLIEMGTPPDELLEALERETLALGEISRMQISVEQGGFMNILVKLLQPSFCLEIGTFTGYSAICIARGLAGDAKLLCCDVSAEWTDIAKRYWYQAGLSERIELKLAPALETIANLPAEQKIDLAFIDADKENYLNYYEAILPRLSSRGVILVDNVLWNGAVVDSSVQDSQTQAIRNFNDFVSVDPRIQSVMLPIADGLTIITPTS